MGKRSLAELIRTIHDHFYIPDRNLMEESVNNEKYIEALKIGSASADPVAKELALKTLRRIEGLKIVFGL